MDDQFERRGAQVVGISVDPPAHNRAMVEKLRLPFPLLSDPQGALSRRYGVWNDDQRIAIPAIVVVDRVGTVCWVYAGHDVADRPGDEDLFAGMRQDTERTHALACISPSLSGFDRCYAACSSAHTSPQRC